MPNYGHTHRIAGGPATLSSTLAGYASEKGKAIKRRKDKHEVFIGTADFIRYGRWFRHTPEGGTYPIKPPPPS